MKFNKIKIVLAGMMVLGICTLNTGKAFASDLNSTPINDEIIQQQLEAFDDIDKEIKENGVQVDKESTEKNARSYPTRKGVVLVTKDGSFGSLVGHAGIIYSSGSTVESFPDGGVATYSNTWNTRYKKVYGASVSGTSATQDASAANVAYSYRGKPYNWNFLNINTTSSFYCSQLVYRGYLDATGKNLNQGGGIVSPIDLIQSSNTYTIYTQGV